MTKTAITPSTKNASYYTRIMTMIYIGGSAGAECVSADSALPVLFRQ